jgi:very-short-patch-repair endonuclease
MENIAIVRQRMSRVKLARARDFRRNMTNAEAIVWQHVRNYQLGPYFRRQQVIRGYIVDFCCVKARLIVEVDGPIHEDPDQILCDQHREAVLVGLGLRILRVSNTEVETDIAAVIAKIRAALASPPAPLHCPAELK